ncbi:hypothetical protein SNK03_007724 [Fusarium graminearum]
MSIKRAIADALSNFPFDSAVGFHNHRPGERPCYYRVVSLRRDHRSVCLIDKSPNRCIICAHGHKNCCARFHVNHGMQECISAFVSTYEVMINHCRTTSSNRTSIASVIQAQELSAQRGILALFYRVLAGETHTAAEVEGNLEAVVPVRVLGAGSIRRGATQTAPGSNNAAADNRSEEREEREEERGYCGAECSPILFHFGCCAVLSLCCF